MEKKSQRNTPIL